MSEYKYNKKKELDWFEKHKINCDEIKKQYMECLSSSRKNNFNKDRIQCVESLNKLLLNRCFIYNDIPLK